ESGTCSASISKSSAARADRNMSVLEGSIGLLQKRVMVDADKADAARRILKDAGIENEIRQK
ncbi:hypothetical protein EN792_045530, partial [Mesorhizobium sp. M00.F.Ca.ET.149.01.1.1]